MRIATVGVATPETLPISSGVVRGAFAQRGKESCYCMEAFDELPPFLIALITGSDLWTFVSSTGALTAGRQSPERALFPYLPEDKLADAAGKQGPVTLVHVHTERGPQRWEPFVGPNDGGLLDRRIYRSELGDALTFEEVNSTLGLAFAYTWRTSSRYGLVRQSELRCVGRRPVRAQVLDGLVNVLPSCTNLALELEFSCLVDAYRHAELHGERLAVFTLTSQVTDKASPLEALRATTAFALGANEATLLLSPRQLPRLRVGAKAHSETRVRGERGAFLLDFAVDLDVGGERAWSIVVDTHQSHGDVVRQHLALQDDTELRAALDADLVASRLRVFQVAASADGIQHTADARTSWHHSACTLFNVMRGGTFAQGYLIRSVDFTRHVKHFNTAVAQRHAEALAALPASMQRSDLVQWTRSQGDPALERLALEHLPLVFSRRHGDPSRPWNRFSIRLEDEDGNSRLGYQGNWRDIFQNWEALGLSYPGYLEHFIAKFANAITPDGHNPYRLTDAGIDWERPEPDNPWANIGYWSDHQVVYLSRLIDRCLERLPDSLTQLLVRPIFTYADVPYRITSLDEMFANPRDTVHFDEAHDAKVTSRRERIGADGALVHGSDGEVLHVTLLEKLLLIAWVKVANLVPGAGTWMNTQRPEWNDANNALVGYGASAVTAFQLLRFAEQLKDLLVELETDDVVLSVEVAALVESLAAVLEDEVEAFASPTDVARGRYMHRAGTIATAYRRCVYERGFSGTKRVSRAVLLEGMASLVTVLEHVRRTCLREDGHYESYWWLSFRNGGASVGVTPLGPMLEGQVAAIATGKLSAQAVGDLVDLLYAGPLYREDQRSFMLYPDRDVGSFFDRNRVEQSLVRGSKLLTTLLDRGDDRIIASDMAGELHFAPELDSLSSLESTLAEVLAELPELDPSAANEVVRVYERVFRHAEYTGRSRSMFAYEGLGSIYWHMVGKLLLAVQESTFAAVDSNAPADQIARLISRYRRIRSGLCGLEKGPEQFGAFPMDPYSHTPAGRGSRQPGMTGQAKEWCLIRMGELGVRARPSGISFEPMLLTQGEFLQQPGRLDYVDVAGQSRTIELEPGSLGFTICQTPVVYHLDDPQSLCVTEKGMPVSVNGTTTQLATKLYSRRFDMRIDVGVTLLVP